MERSSSGLDIGFQVKYNIVLFLYMAWSSDALDISITQKCYMSPSSRFIWTGRDDKNATQYTTGFPIVDNSVNYRFIVHEEKWNMQCIEASNNQPLIYVVCFW